MLNTMKNLLFCLTLAGFASLLLVACHKDHDEPFSETRHFDAFHALYVDMPGKLVLHAGTDLHAELRGHESIIPHLVTSVHGGTLHIEYSGSPSHAEDMEIHLTVPDLDALELHGSGDVESFDLLTGDDLDLRVAGSGDLLLRNVLYHSLDADMTGSGNAVVVGEADVLTARVSGSGNLHVEDCPVKTATVFVTGSGNLYCYVLDLLQATVSGSGNVWYRGAPLLDLNITGSGEVKPF